MARSSIDPYADHSIWSGSNWGDAWNKIFRSGGGGGGSQEFGGLSEEDEEFKKMLYDKFGELPDEYESYTGDRFADKSPEEIALMKQMQEGHPMYDAASKDLGFTKGVYKTGAEYGVGDLDRDTSELMSGDPYRNEVSERILRQMNQGASMSGMDIRGQGIGAGAAFGDRGDVARLRSNLGYQREAGDALSKLHYGALRDARKTARGLQEGREISAGRFGKTALEQLGIGTDKITSRFGAYKGDRDYKDRDLNVAYKDWQAKKNFPYKNLSLGSSFFGGMPIEEKGYSQQPASGGK